MKPEAVESDMKSSAHTWLGRSACNRLAGTVLSPSCRRLDELWGTLSACSCQIRCTRLWFICQPSFRSPAPACRKPHLGQVLEISRSRCRSSSSGAASDLGAYRVQIGPE
jgi:hypothetical protein